jgi:hypothetical protein
MVYIRHDKNPCGAASKPIGPAGEEIRKKLRRIEDGK